ncbi:MAG: hypothetical protein PVF27_08185 [Gemmatimonadales bacterium]
MSQTPVQDLRRIAEAVAQLRGKTVHDVEIRADCRQLRVILTDGQLLLVSVLLDEDGRPRLDVDLLQTSAEAAQRQLEVRFGGTD